MIIRKYIKVSTVLTHPFQAPMPSALAFNPSELLSIFVFTESPNELILLNPSVNLSAHHNFPTKFKIHTSLGSQMTKQNFVESLNSMLSDPYFSTKLHIISTTSAPLCPLSNPSLTKSVPNNPSHSSLSVHVSPTETLDSLQPLSAPQIPEGLLKITDLDGAASISIEFNCFLKHDYYIYIIIQYYLQKQIM